MNKATITPAIDRNHPRKDKTCSIYIRVTFQRRKREYPTGISMLPADFDRIMTAQRKKAGEIGLYNKILSYYSKGADIIEKLPIFTFELFESLYLSNTEAADSIKTGFEKHIRELTDENRIGTAVSYTTALKSLENFKSGLKYADITPELLRKYEATMLAEGKSRTTIGIYLRSLRTIINRADIDKKLYPFGSGRNKYSIPQGENIKKALTIDTIKQIYDYVTNPGSAKAMAKDYWIFIYLCNGINVKDLCLLKYKNIDRDFLTYERAKTIRSKNKREIITISLKPEALEIINRYGQPNLTPDTYIFPHLKEEMSEVRKRQIYQQLTKTINKHLKQIAKDLNIKENLTTYYARHSFATILRDSGAQIEFISEALGHSSIKTTQHYLARFQKETVHTITDALIAFKS